MGFDDSNEWSFVDPDNEWYVLFPDNEGLIWVTDTYWIIFGSALYITENIREWTNV